MSLEFGSSAAIVFSSLFFADCHCHAAPVIARADTAMSAAMVRATTTARRRCRSSWPVRGPPPGAAERALLSRAIAARSGSSRRPAGTGIGVVASESSSTTSALRRVTGLIWSLPVTFAISSATETPSV